MSRNINYEAYSLMLLKACRMNTYSSGIKTFIISCIWTALILKVIMKKSLVWVKSIYIYTYSSED